MLKFFRVAVVPGSILTSEKFAPLSSVISALPFCGPSIEIDGPQNGNALITEDSGANFSLVKIEPGTTATLKNFNISGGHASYGGGIDNFGTLTLEESAV